jgi:hypothetical protein
MIHKTSILILEFADGTQDLIVDGVQVLAGEVVRRDIGELQYSQATTESVLGCLERAVATLRRVKPKQVEDGPVPKGWLD